MTCNYPAHVFLYSPFCLKFCHNLAEHVGTKENKSGAEVPIKQENPDEPIKVIADQAISRKINPHGH
jgi:hypothetical protein